MSASAAPAPVSVSIVIEWENVLLSEFERCRRMLDQLASQTERLAVEWGTGDGSSGERFEIVVVIDPEEVERTAVEATLREHLPERAGVRTVRISEAPGLAYYGLKNHGAEVTSGDVLVFVDSDVIPDDGWLGRLLGSLGGGVRAVGGNAYIDPTGPVEKAFAATWFFAERREQPALEVATEFYANNVAFERAVFERYRFRLDASTTRGACVDMAERMARDGVGIHRQWGAQVAHPPPNGLCHFATRGIAQGRDSLLLLPAAEPTGRRRRWRHSGASPTTCARSSAARWRGAGPSASVRSSCRW